MASKQSELDELKRLDATPVKNSGRGAHQKGDGIIKVNDEPTFTVDVKEYKNSYSLSRDNLAKINADALKNHTQPLLFVVLGDEEPKQRYVVISEIMFNELLDAYEKIDSGTFEDYES